MVDEKSLLELEKGFEKQILFLNEINNTLESIRVKSRESIINPNIDSSVRRNCLKTIVEFRKNLKNIIEKNIKPFDQLTQLKKTIPLESSQLKIIEDFPNKLNELYNIMILGIFGNDKNNISLNSLLENRYYSLEEIIEKTIQLEKIINESQYFIKSFLSNLKENESKIISLQSEKENFRVDFIKILKENRVNLEKDQILIFDSNFLIHYLEDQKIAAKKNKYLFTFPKNSKIVIFDKNFEESNHRLFGKSKSIKQLVRYLSSINGASKFTNLGDSQIKNILFNIWYDTGLSNHKDENKFFNSLDMDILEFCTKVSNIQTIIFSSDPDIIQVVNRIKTKQIQGRDLFTNQTFSNIRIISFDQKKEKRKLKIAI